MNTAAEPSLVAVRLPAGPHWVRTVEDIWAAGDAVLPLPVDAPSQTVDEMISALRPAALIDATGRSQVDGGVPVERGTAAVLATSGSTGDPKGAVLSWDSLHASARASLERLEVGAGDRWLACLPLHHVAGLQVLVRSRLMGVPAVVQPRFSVDDVAAEHSVTLVALVPTMLRRLLDARTDLASLRCVLLGGAPAGQRLLDDAAVAGLRVVTTYGMTETSGGCVYDGVPLDGVQIALDADDRISIAGPVVFSGYRLRDDLTAATLSGGWLSTQDLGGWTDQGRLEVLGRADDVIITGGEKVRAGWLAALLEQHPAVTEAAVVGRPDEQWGQRVVAYVIARGAAPTTEELRAFVRRQAPPHAAPREVVVVDDLPRLPSGKIDRLALVPGD